MVKRYDSGLGASDRSRAFYASIGGEYILDYPETPEEAIASCRRLGVMSLAVAPPEGVIDDSLDDVGWVGELADQLVSLGIGTWDPSGMEAWPVFPKLRSLSVSYWKGPLDFSKFPALEHLNTTSPGSGFESVGGARRLRHLWVYAYPFADLLPLSGLELRSLSINNSKKLVSLEGLANRLPSLRHLELSLCSQLADVSGLVDHEGLVQLWIDGCNRVEDLSALSSLTNLRYLNLVDSRRVADLSPLAGHPSLEVAMLSCRAIEDLEPLTTAPNLRFALFGGSKKLKQWEGVLPEDEVARDESYAFRIENTEIGPSAECGG